MIIWLASYPRSGNTLLRTIFHQTMGLPSYPERTEWPRILETSPTLREIDLVYGELHPEMPWEEFYPAAVASEKVHLVKTHEAPMDDQPAIYVVRDARKAIYSYLQFHRAHHPELKRNLLELIAGHDYYGDWSSHYRAWNEYSDAPRVVVRYEELRHATPGLIRGLADFTGHLAEPRSWENPFEALHKKAPDVFREGKSEWERPEDWGEDAEWLFSVFHGPLMAALDYEEARQEDTGDVWEEWRDRAADTAITLLDSTRTMCQSVRRAEAETALLRARFLI